MKEPTPAAKAAAATAFAEARAAVEAEDVSLAMQLACRAVALDPWGRPLQLNAPWWFWNLFGEQAVFLLSRKD